ncbi:MAG: alpha-N-acetylglucosaminidase [Bacteroidales bacterium]|nr:alpha-N-acetylglucosaminidase [Bacteroidales bacterium]
MKTMHCIRDIAFLLFWVCSAPAVVAEDTPTEKSRQEQAALAVINRFTDGQMKVKVALSLEKDAKNCDRYAYSATSDELTVEASSAVAACRGFYDYIRSKHAGYCGWSGSRFQMPEDMTQDTVTMLSQFRDHQYFNVVTYGYSLPYWDESRWDQEIDWMALHGIDMPLMLVGAEQIYREVFYEMGLSKAEVDEWEVGPAHLPWFRMGNLAGNTFDGPLGEEWNRRQRALAHHLLDRMRALGMKPVCPAFGGFVPKAFTRHHNGTTESTGWNWIPADCPNYRLNPGSTAFVEVGRRFLQKWEQEFGVSKYYLSDSFNEMEIPSSTATLTQYGDSIFKSITEGSAHPEVVWVTQGWTFVYQSASWGNEKFKALTRNIPDHRFMALYMSPEYGPDKCWEQYKGFDGKEWCYTMLPNMGGKSFRTGNFSHYANTYLTNLYASSVRGNCTGYGITPEGIENNEMLYELICDAGWTPQNGIIDLNKWLKQYACCRYGQYTDAEDALLHMLCNTVYSTYIDHPRYGWQTGTNITGTGNALPGDSFYQGLEKFFSDTEALKRRCSPLLEAELIELVALYVSGYVEKISAKVLTLADKPEAAGRLIDELDDLMTDLDAALELHPLCRLQRWEEMAVEMAETDSVKKRNARNARRIVTVWYGHHTYDEPVQDYAARLWSGLVRDFYRPRLVNTLKQRLGMLDSFDHIAFENAFVAAAPVLSEARAVEGDHIEFLSALIQRAKSVGAMAERPDAPAGKSFFQSESVQQQINH